MHPVWTAPIMAHGDETAAKARLKSTDQTFMLGDAGWRKSGVAGARIAGKDALAAPPHFNMVGIVG